MRMCSRSRIISSASDFGSVECGVDCHCTSAHCHWMEIGKREGLGKGMAPVPSLPPSVPFRSVLLIFFVSLFLFLCFLPCAVQCSAVQCPLCPDRPLLFTFPLRSYLLPLYLISSVGLVIPRGIVRLPVAPRLSCFRCNCKSHQISCSSPCPSTCCSFLCLDCSL
jgi:hypothetical protein